MNDRAWFDHAKCKGMKPAVFFPDGKELFGRKLDDAKETALRICAVCPVRDQCLQWAMTHNETGGIWGGLTEGQRADRRTTRRRRSRGMAGAA